MKKIYEDVIYSDEYLELSGKSKEEFIKKITEILTKLEQKISNHQEIISKEFSLKIFREGNDYQDSSFAFSLRISRKETDSEEKKRTEREKKEEEYNKNKEYAQYLLLSGKYGDSAKDKKIKELEKQLKNYQKKLNKLKEWSGMF